MAVDYKQYNYPYYPYAGETIAAAGCGPCAVADLIEIDPTKTADWMEAHGYAYPYQGTAYSGINACLTAFGANGKMIAQNQDGQYDNENFKKWRSEIQSGKEGVLLMHAVVSTYWTRGGHYIAIVGYKDGYYLVYDPASSARTGWHTFDDFAGDISALYTSSMRWDSEKLALDGYWGKATTKRAQSVFGTLRDGIVSNQSSSMTKYLTRCLSSSWEFVKPEKVKNGSSLVKAIQKKIGATADGVFGLKTAKAFQKWLGVEVDGYIGEKTVKAFQKWLNNQ